MKKLIALLLCFVMILPVMAGCGKDKDSADAIIGTWKADVALADYMDMSELGDMGSYFDTDKLTMSFNLEFTKDGKYTLTVDAKSIDNMVDAMMEGFEAYFKDFAESQGMTVEDILSASGVSSVQELIEATGALDEMDDLKEMKETGTYTWSDSTGVLLMDGEETDAKLDGDTLTIEVEDINLVMKRQ